jgi:hypothetical protein
MHAIVAPVQELIRILRGTDLAAAADDIEEHLRVGKVPKFTQSDFGEEALENRMKSFFPPDGKSAESIELNEEEEGTPYSYHEQIDEALEIISRMLSDFRQYTLDSERILASEFNLGDGQLVVEGIDGELHPLIMSEAFDSGLRDWTDRVESVRLWLHSMTDRS